MAAGHGRNWGAGAVTGCYGPLLLGARDAFGCVAPAIEFRDTGNGRGLPESVVSLVRRPGLDSIEVAMHNGSDTPATVEWRLSAMRKGAPPDWTKPGEWVTTDLAASETKTYRAKDTGAGDDNG